MYVCMYHTELVLRGYLSFIISCSIIDIGNYIHMILYYSVDSLCTYVTIHVESLCQKKANERSIHDGSQRASN